MWSALYGWISGFMLGYKSVNYEYEYTDLTPWCSICGQAIQGWDECFGGDEDHLYCYLCFFYCPDLVTEMELELNRDAIVRLTELYNE